MSSDNGFYIRIMFHSLKENTHILAMSRLTSMVSLRYCEPQCSLRIYRRIYFTEWREFYFNIVENITISYYGTRRFVFSSRSIWIVTWICLCENVEKASVLETGGMRICVYFYPYIATFISCISVAKEKCSENFVHFF